MGPPVTGWSAEAPPWLIQEKALSGGIPHADTHALADDLVNGR